MAKKDRKSVTVGGVTVFEGALEGKTADGKHWSPVACGAHRSQPLIERASNHVGAPKGFRLGCEDCAEELQSTAEHVLHYGTAP